MILAAAIAFVLAAPQVRYSIAHEPAAGPGSPMVFVLRDNDAGLETSVAPSEGGELSSLKVRLNGAWVELVYRAREYGAAAGWRGKAPLLWPAVGGQYPPGVIPKSSCADGAWLLHGHTYPMPCHGFAQQLAWRETEASAGPRSARVVVELSDSAATRERYPFGFRVQAAYELAEGRLAITYTVLADAANSEPMPFSIGNHVSFRVPFLDGTNPAAMLFESPSTMELLRDANGLAITEVRPRSFAVPQRLGDFDATVALPLTGYPVAAYARLADPRGLALRIVHQAGSALAEPLVRFNVWGGPKQGFLCPEPWFGVQNSLNRGVGLVRLAPGASWQWKIEFVPEISPTN